MRWSDIFQAILVFLAKLSLGTPSALLKAFGSGYLIASQSKSNLYRRENLPKNIGSPTVFQVLAFNDKKYYSKATNVTEKKLSLSKQKKGYIRSGAKFLCGTVGKYTGLSTIISFVSGIRKPKKKVLILMSDTGGGHRASAKALDQALNDLFPGRTDVNIMDIWSEHAKWPFNTFVTSYRFLAKHPILWRVTYIYGFFPPTKLFTEVLSYVTCYDSFKKAIETADPDVVVSVHPLCQHIPVPIVQSMNKKRSPEKAPIPFVTVVTDLGGAHPTWFHQGCDRVYVASEAVRKIAIKRGIPPEQVAFYGLPIRPSFWKPAKSKERLRAELGLDKEGKTVLLMGGGDGVGGLAKIAVAVADDLSKGAKRSQMIVICGHNQQMAAQLLKRAWPQNVKVLIKGFCDNIDDVMSSSDLLVTKAGPGTIAESMIRGLPVVLSSFLPGQEAGNVPYVVDGGFGVYTGNKPLKIAAAVSRMMNDDSLLGEMSRKARLESHQDATTSIARDMGHEVLGF